MTSGRKRFDTQPLEQPVFGEEAELTAQRVVPLAEDASSPGGRGRFRLSTWAALLIVSIAIGAGMLAGLAIGSYSEPEASQAPRPAVEESTAAVSESPQVTTTAAEPPAKEIAQSAVTTDEPEPVEDTTPKTEMGDTGVRDKSPAEKTTKKAASDVIPARRNNEERAHRSTAKENENPASRTRPDSSANSIEERERRREERRRERAESRAERPRRVNERGIERIQDIFMGPRSRPE